jgi:hypothetical protein
LMSCCAGDVNARYQNDRWKLPLRLNDFC